MAVVSGIFFKIDSCERFLCCIQLIVIDRLIIILHLVILLGVKKKEIQRLSHFAKIIPHTISYHYLYGAVTV